MPYALENLRLKELALIVEQNRPIFDDLLTYLRSRGYRHLHNFVTDRNGARAAATLKGYFDRPLPNGVALYDGVARPYAPSKAKWLLLGWIFRDAPEQRLRPMIASMSGASVVEKQVQLLNLIRAHLASVFPDRTKWEWSAISEVVLDRLEGSRRAIKGTLFEAIVRRHLSEIFAKHELSLEVSDKEVRLEGETYDVSVVGKRGRRILLPVKTRETMGGGHAGIFTRDIHKSIHAAREAGYRCVPVIIAESWGADLHSLECEDCIYIDRNPNQIREFEHLLAQQLENRLEIFQSLAK